ncbi:Cro/CI family transcriptional regulator [uncultured Acinetobacter sp.]|uniref:Cro/CI family transcriptional regulator n=1 Tax=uncultured Acinetobacter sp. TaxID=165433 RepID=UPI00260BF9F3|nr:Cro/CI family transcriptional regulator [uncultured Acinetobacter sp.]
MTVIQLLVFYKVQNKSKLAKKLNVCRSTITGWEKNGIPPRTQATFEVLTNGKLKADRQALAP